MNLHLKIFVSVFLIAYFLLPIYFFRRIFIVIPMNYYSFMLAGLFFHLSIAIAGLSTISSVVLRVLLLRVRHKSTNGFKIGAGTKVFVSVFLIVYLSALFFEVVLSRFYYEHPLIDLSLERRSYYSLLNFATTFYGAALLAGLSTLLFKGYLTARDWREWILGC